MREDSILFFPAVAVVYCEWVHVPLVAFHHEMLEDGFGCGTLFGFHGISITILITGILFLKHIREILNSIRPSINFWQVNKMRRFEHKYPNTTILDEMKLKHSLDKTKKWYKCW